MFSLTHVVLFTTVLFAAQAIDGPYCTRAAYGTTVGREVPLSTIDIPAGTVDDDLVIPQGCLQSEYQAGTALYVCDIEVAPIVYVTSLFTAVVHRQSSAITTSSVQMWNYCV